MPFPVYGVTCCPFSEDRDRALVIGSVSLSACITPNLSNQQLTALQDEGHLVRPYSRIRIRASRSVRRDYLKVYSRAMAHTEK